MRYVLPDQIRFKNTKDRRYSTHSYISNVVNMVLSYAFSVRFSGLGENLKPSCHTVTIRELFLGKKKDKNKQQANT